MFMVLLLTECTIQNTLRAIINFLQGPLRLFLHFVLLYASALSLLKVVELLIFVLCVPRFLDPGRLEDSEPLADAVYALLCVMMASVYYFVKYKRCVKPLLPTRLTMLSMDRLLDKFFLLYIPKSSKSLHESLATCSRSTISPPSTYASRSWNTVVRSRNTTSTFCTI